MFSIAFRLYQNEPDKYDETLNISDYFEKIFAQYDNKQLTPSAATTNMNQMDRKKKDPVQNMRRV